MKGATYAIVSPEATHRDERRTDPPTVFEGDYDGLLQFIDAQQWSDGLPIVPPTLEAVERMLAATALDRATQLGVIPPFGVDATVWDTAVNGVMAGCRPHDLPILIAVVRAMADDDFRLQDAGSTTGWEPLILLSGPNLDDRGFGSGVGAMRVGRRANTSIGRFGRLWIRNVAGIRTPPGETDACAIGQTFFVAMAEDETATRSIGWPTLRERWGFDANDEVVAVQGVVGTSLPIYTTGGSPRDHIDGIARQIAGMSGFFASAGVLTGSWWPVLAINPAIAEVFSRGGLNPQEVAEAIAAEALAPARHLEDGMRGLMMRELDLPMLVQRGRAPSAYHMSDDPDRLVPVIPEADSLAIVVTGSPARNQSKYYTPCGAAGRRVIRAVEPPVRGESHDD